MTEGNTTLTLFESDLEYLQHEHHWLEQRSLRIEAERALSGRSRHGRRHRFYDNDDEVPEATLRRRVLAAGREEEALRQALDARLAEHLRQDQPLAMQRMVQTFGLSAFERLVLIMSAGPALDLSFESILERAGQDGLVVDTAFTFAGFELSERVAHRRDFGVSAPLRVNDLVQLEIGGRYTSPEDLLTAYIKITGHALDLLLGEQALGSELEEFSSLEQPLADLRRVVLPERDKERILSVVERHELYLEKRAAWGFDDVIRYGRGALMLFHGPPGTGKTMTAHAVARHLGLRVLNVDIPTFVQSGEAQRFLPGLFREARLHDAVLFFDECDALFESRQRGNTLMTLLLTEIERFEGVAVLATNRPEVLDEAMHRRILVKVRFDKPDVAAREAIWRGHIPERAPLSEDVDLHDLAVRFELTGGEIKNALLVAVAATVHEHGGEGPITQAHLEVAAADQLQKPDADADEYGADRLEWPRARQADLVLPPAVEGQLEELIAAARTRRTVVDTWGVGAHLSGGHGVIGLLHGPPGTGKTLFAEVVAGELGRPLLRSVVPGLLSRWVGDTERRIAQLFENARRHHAVLLLDEVDALLMERGAGQASRHDDAHVSMLLDQLERHEGVVLMATNRPAVLDPALARRVGWRIEVPMPDATARAAIWDRLLPPKVPREAPIDVERLAARHPISGGLIRTAVFRACYRAAHRNKPLSQHLLDEAASEQSGVASEVEVMMTLPTTGEC